MRIGLDVKWYTSPVNKSVVNDEIDQAYANDCDTLVIVCANGWTSGAAYAAEDEEGVDVHLVYPSDDMKEMGGY